MVSSKHLVCRGKVKWKAEGKLEDYLSATSKGGI